MARSQRLFKKTYNYALVRVSQGDIPQSVSSFARDLQVSRTTARAVIEKLLDAGIITASAVSGYEISRKVHPDDMFSDSEIQPTEDAIESMFMDWMVREKIQPGAIINETRLAKVFGVSPGTLREHFIRLERLSFLRKEPRRHWVLAGLSQKYAQDVHDVRKMFEVRGVRRVAQIPKTDPFWLELSELERLHKETLLDVETKYLDAPGLDNRFHDLISQAADNTLLLSIMEAVSMIYLYHYHHFWDRTARIENARLALADHLEIISALVSGNGEQAARSMDRHLENARRHLRPRAEEPEN